MNIAHIALKNLKRNTTRTWLLIAIVSVVSGAIFSAAIFLKSADHAIKSVSDRLGADILVVPENAELKAKAAILSGEPTHFLMDKAILEKAKGIKGVKRVAPQLFIKPAPFTCCYNVDVFLIAFDPETDFTINPWLEKHIRRKIRADEVIAGKNIPVVPGDTILFFGTGFKIAGTMELTGMDFFDRAVFMSMDAAYKMAEDSRTKAKEPIEVKRDKISAVLVQVKDDYSADKVAIMLEHEIKGIKALVSDTVLITVKKQLSRLTKAALAISVILWIIVLLIMALAFFMIVNERTREIGLLKAMGANKAHISAMILLEASMLSGLGSIAGTLLGFVLLANFKGLILHYLKLPYIFPSSLYLVAAMMGSVVTSVFTGLLSALLPSINASKIDPYEAVRRF